MKGIFCALTILTSAASVSCLPAAAEHTLEQRAKYTLRCNEADLPKSQRNGVLRDIEQWIDENEEVPGHATRWEVVDGQQRKVMRFKKAHVTLRIWKSGGEVSRSWVLFENVVKGVKIVNDQCGKRGGSVGAPDQGEVIVHVTDYWV